jgi:hypothetical protein
MTTIHLADDLGDRLIAFGTSVEGNSLYLLRAIAETVDSLEARERLANAIADNASLLAKVISAREPIVGKLLDPDDKAINGIESAYRGLEEILPKMQLKKAAIDEDSSLDDGHSELLHMAYERCMSAVAWMIEAAKNLRAAVITHDLAAEPRSQQRFEDLEVVISDLRSSPAA